jgi:uncharacterized alpha-E superfamily protein
MLSRVAENLYWMARYLERAENTARLINSTTQVLLDLPREAKFGWDVVVKVAGLDQLFHELHPQADETSVIRFLILDEHNPSAIVSCIRNARENSRTFREVLPREFWERINSLHLYIQRAAARTTHGRGERFEVLNEIVDRRQSIAGLLAGCMSHDVAFQFIRLGESIERADMTTRIVDVNSAVLLPSDGVVSRAVLERLWMGTLKALSAYQMYRRHVGVHITGSEVVHFLLTDQQFPRSVVHGLSEVEGALAALPSSGDAMKALRTAWRRLIGLRFDDLAPVVLHDYLDQVQADLGAIHEAIRKQYFDLYHEAPAPVAAVEE